MVAKPLPGIVKWDNEQVVVNQEINNFCTIIDFK